MDHQRAATENMVFSIHEVGMFCNLSFDEVQELLEYGAISCDSDIENEQQFNRPIVLMLQTANQLRKDYDLDLFTIVLIMDFLKKIERLEQRLALHERSHRAYLTEM